jgi:hypothetical protein
MLGIFGRVGRTDDGKCCGGDSKSGLIDTWPNFGTQKAPQPKEDEETIYRTAPVAKKITPAKKLAAVIFRRIGKTGAICVLVLENFLSYKDIFERYGDAVSHQYYFGGVSMAIVDGEIWIHDGDDIGSPSVALLRAGGCYTPKDFFERIELMKLCGKRLGKIRREETEKVDVQRIVI